MQKLTENSIEVERVRHKNVQVTQDSAYFIKYTGVVMVEHLDEYEQENRYGKNLGPIDFLIPRKEQGFVKIRKINRNLPAYNRMFFVPCSESEMSSICGKLLIRVRNILFVDAMIFMKHEGKVLRIENNHGPLYLYMSNHDFWFVRNQLMSKEIRSL